MTITGQTLRLLRQMRDMKQAELATMLGISQARYSAIEKKDRIEGILLKRLLRALRFTAGEVAQLEQTLFPPRR